MSEGPRRSSYRPSALVACRHGLADDPQPCPPMCPVQMWPHYLFRLRFFGKGWKLKRKYRDVAERNASHFDAR